MRKKALAALPSCMSLLSVLLRSYSVGTMDFPTLHSLDAANALIDAAKTISVSTIFATLHCGEFLCLQNGTVGRLLDVGWFCAFDAGINRQRILIHHYCLVPGGPFASTNKGTPILDERVATHTASWENVDSIEDVFFVFTASSVLSDRFYPQGIENAACYRCFRQEDGVLVDVDVDDDVEEPLFAGVDGYYTHSQLIFDFLTRVRLSTIKALSTKRIFV